MPNPWVTAGGWVLSSLCFAWLSFPTSESTFLTSTQVLINSTFHVSKPKGTANVTFSVIVWKCVLINDFTHLGSINFLTGWNCVGKSAIFFLFFSFFTFNSCPTCQREQWLVPSSFLQNPTSFRNNWTAKWPLGSLTTNRLSLTSVCIIDSSFLLGQ